MTATVRGIDYPIGGDIDWNGHYRDEWSGNGAPTCECGEVMETPLLVPNCHYPTGVECEACGRVYPIQN